MQRLVHMIGPRSPSWPGWHSLMRRQNTGRGESNVRSDPLDICVFEPKSRILRD